MKVISCAALVLIGATQATFAETQAPAGKITVMSAQVLPSSGVGADDYADFTSKPNYFGAFALTANGLAGYTFQYNSLAVAKAEAIAYCQSLHAVPCQLYAIMEPSDAQSDLPEPMSAGAATAYREYLTEAGHKAFAHSDTGAYGMTWDMAREDEARSEAMAICTKYAADEAALDPASTTCRIIASD